MQHFVKIRLTSPLNGMVFTAEGFFEVAIEFRYSEVAIDH